LPALSSSAASSAAAASGTAEIAVSVCTEAVTGSDATTPGPAGGAAGVVVEMSAVVRFGALSPFTRAVRAAGRFAAAGLRAGDFLAVVLLFTPRAADFFDADFFDAGFLAAAFLGAAFFPADVVAFFAGAFLPALLLLFAMNRDPILTNAPCEAHAASYQAVRMCAVGQYRAAAAAGQ
jgi:hypothetical protein